MRLLLNKMTITTIFLIAAFCFATLQGIWVLLLSDNYELLVSSVETIPKFDKPRSKRVYQVLNILIVICYIISCCTVSSPAGLKNHVWWGIGLFIWQTVSPLVLVQTFAIGTMAFVMLITRLKKLLMKFFK